MQERDSHAARASGLSRLRARFSGRDATTQTATADLEELSDEDMIREVARNMASELGIAPATSSPDDVPDEQTGHRVQSSPPDEAGATAVPVVHHEGAAMTAVSGVPNDVAPMGKHEALQRILAGVRRSIPELHGAMIASVDGLPVAHEFAEADADRVAAMAATALGLGKRISERTNLGGFQEAVVRGENGYMVAYAAGDQAVLVLSGPSDSNLGLMRIEARAASVLISRLLG